MAIPRLPPMEWQGLAATFAHTFVRASPSPVDIRDVEKLKMAFLLGVKFVSLLLVLFVPFSRH